MRAAFAAALAAVLLWTSTPAEAMTSNRYESRVVAGLNRVRTHEVGRDACLDRQALKRARAVKGRAYGDLEHLPLLRVLYRCGYYRAGEVLARTKAGPRDLVYFWSQLSPRHAAVVHSDLYSRVGIASIRDGEKRLTVAIFAGRR